MRNVSVRIVDLSIGVLFLATAGAKASFYGCHPLPLLALASPMLKAMFVDFSKGV
jgi:hypothetical protein